MLSTRADRTGRGVAAAAIATFVAAFSHSVANAEPAPVLGVLLALVCAVPVCIALAGRTLSWVRLACAIGISQFAFHGLLQMGLGGGAFSVGSATHAHGAATQALLSGASEADSAAGVASHAGHTSAAMWFAHVLAAVITVLAVGAGERALVAILGLGRLRRVAELFAWLPAFAGARRAPLAIWHFTGASLACLAEIRRRGPPLAA